MSDTITLQATPRELGGKGAAKAVRREGRVPAVIYGDKKDPVPVTLEYLPLLKQYESGSLLSTVYAVELNGKKQLVIPKDVQLDPVRDFLMHVDLMRVTKGSTIAVAVSVTFLNEEICPGLKRGGALNVVRYEVELNCPADAIPETIEIDLAEADIGDSIHISAITLPDGVTPTITDRDFTIATIASPGGSTATDDEEAEVEEGEAPADQ